MFLCFGTILAGDLAVGVFAAGDRPKTTKKLNHEFVGGRIYASLNKQKKAL